MTIASKTYAWHLLRSGAGALLLAAGCSGDPALYLGGPPGPAAELQLSTSRLILRAGESRALGAQPRDAVGNPTGDAVTFGSCDASKITVASAGATEQWSQTATVTGLGLGESCVAVSAGAVSDTVRVAVGPGSIVISGPDTVLSGGEATFELEFYDLNGTQLTPGPDFPIPTVVSLNEFRLPLSPVDPLTYDAAGQQPGTAEVQTTTTADFGSVTGNKVVTIVPGVFAGTLSASTAAQGDAIVVTAAIPWDGDEYVQIGGAVGALWSGLAADAVSNPATGSLTFRVPWTLVPGSYEVVVVNQGSGQVAEAVTSLFTVTAGTPVANRNGFPGNFTSGAELRTKVNLSRPLAFPVVFNPTVTGSTNSYYTMNNSAAAGQGNAGEVVVRATLDWVDSCGDICDESADEDFDIELIDGGFTAFVDLDGAGFGKPEVTHFNVNDGSFYFFRYRTYTGAGASHAVIEWLGNGFLCADEADCVIDGRP